MVIMPSCNKILIVKLDHIGDVIWTLPVIDSIRRSFPEARVDALVTTYTKPILDNNPVLTNIWAYPYPYPRQRKLKYDFIKPIRDERYDCVLVFDPRDEAGFLAWLSKAPFRAGHYYPDKPLSVIKHHVYLTHPFVHPINRKGFHHLHEVQVNMQLLRDLGCEDDTPAEINLPIEKELAQNAVQVLHGLGLSSQKSFVAIHLSNSCATPWFDDDWPLDYFEEFITLLVSHSPNEQILVSIGPKEQKLYNHLVPILERKNIPFITNLGIKQWAAIIRHARVLVSTDTGVIHVASAVHVPVIGIYKMSNKAHIFRWCPYGVWHRNLLREEHPGDFQKAKERLISGILEGIAEVPI